MISADIRAMVAKAQSSYDTKIEELQKELDKANGNKNFWTASLWVTCPAMIMVGGPYGFAACAASMIGASSASNQAIALEKSKA